MCPVPPVSIPIDIDVHSTDEELVLFLGRRRIGDPIPTNVITEVNPFSTDPQNYPDKIWFLYESHNEGSIIKATNGYWLSIDDLRVSTSTSTVGRKTIREFYLGQAPSGDRTDWRMHEYRAEQVLAQGINKSKDNGRLCRFFQQNDEPLDNEEQCDIVSSGDTGGDFLKGDFLELKDLYDRESSSSSSDNSTILSMNSDECFDAESMLRDIENEGGLDMEEHAECRFSVAASVRSDRVVIQPPPPPPPAFGDKRCLVVVTDASTSSVPAPNHLLSSSAVEPQSDSDASASASASSRGRHRRASSSGSSQESKAIRRMAKLGKYCCFGSF